MKYEWGLIDFKRLCDDIECWQQHDDPTLPDYDTRDIDVVIGYQPIVEAIPVEWLEELSTKLKEDNFEKAMFLLDVIDVWRKENETW